MKRPEKKVIKTGIGVVTNFKKWGFNQACERWEKFHEQELKEWKELLDASYKDTKYFEAKLANLPSKEGIVDCISNLESNIKYMKLTKIQKRFIAKAIHNRIHKGKE